MGEQHPGPKRNDERNKKTKLSKPFTLGNVSQAEKDKRLKQPGYLHLLARDMFSSPPEQVNGVVTSDNDSNDDNRSGGPRKASSLTGSNMNKQQEHIFKYQIVLNLANQQASFYPACFTICCLGQDEGSSQW